MKTLILFILNILIFSNLLAQKELTLDNSLTGIYNTSKTSQFGVNFIGNNSLDLNKKISLDLVTNYQSRFSPKIIDNELIQRVNLGYSREYYDVFTTYQFNYSLVRGIQSNNWIGVGGGLKKKFNWGKISISYAVLYDNTYYIDSEITQTIRHSIRPKIKLENKFFSLSSEYFYQPSISDKNDFIVYGNTKLLVLPQNKVNFVIQDVLNYRSISDVKTIHALTFGLNYKFTKTY